MSLNDGTHRRENFLILKLAILSSRAMDKALVSLTFDDGLRCQFERAIPVLREHNFLATFFLIANTDPIHTDGVQHPDWPKINWSQQDIGFLKDLIRQGHEIGAHSVHHREPFLSVDPKGEAENSKRWIEERLEKKVLSYCYPFYRVTGPIKSAVIAAGYAQSRAGSRNSYYTRQSSVDWFEVDCRQILRTGENVGSWVRPGCWHVLTFHGIGTEQDGWEPITAIEFARQMAELARYRDQGSVEVVTFAEGADRWRQNERLSSQVP
jgi:peptidoglycan/xylan/chitin deacetylase (PgdA/CDA1 family)